jgi:hypothetical protein
MLLVACASKAPPKPDEARVHAFAGTGYLKAERNAVATTLATWRIDGRIVDIALSVPTRRGPFPLVVYLPALGESRSAGEVWRTTWSKAGYAVLSLQPLADDAEVWSSAQARAGDFSDIARERYSAAAMTSRVEALRYALGELIRRRNGTDELLDQVDLTRSAIAGYDLGAYVAMLVAGEKKRNVATPDLPLNVAAIIAVSPFADHADPASANRYGDIHVPVLSITGDADTDPLGLVSSASARRTPFELMPAGEKYLLDLANAGHRTLAGNALGAESSQDSDSRKSGHRQRKPAKDPDGNDADWQGGIYLGGVDIDRRISPTEAAIAVTAVQGVTTAFLDACLKNDPRAREWLRKEASRWLIRVGELKVR